MHIRFLIFIILFKLLALKGFSQDSINKIYYPTGQLKSFQIQKDSLTFFEKNYYENGKVAGEGIGIYKSGKYIPINFKIYYENGQLRSNTTDSLVRAYEEDGSLYMYIELSNGKRNGKVKYYLSGKLAYIMNYKNDKKDGTSISYDFKTGKKSLEETYKDGVQLGPSIHFSQDGHIEKKIYFEADCPIKAIYFNKKGKTIKVITDKKQLRLLEGKSFDCKE